MVEEVHKEQSPQDIEDSGQSNMTSTPLQFIAINSQTSNSSKQTSEAFQMSLFNLSSFQTSSYSVFLAPLIPLPESVPGLRAISVNCFLKQSDFFDFSSLNTFWLKTSKDSSVPIRERISSRYWNSSRNWGMWGLGNSETDSGTSRKTAQGYSFWVCVGDVRCTQPVPGRKSLSECLDSGDAVIDRHPDGTRHYSEHSPALRAGGKRSGASLQVELDSIKRIMYPEEAERLMGWEPSSTKYGIDADNNQYEIPKSHRKRILGNGIIPSEVTELLTSLKELMSDD